MANLGTSCNVETVLQAVNKLYHEPNTAEKEKASRWLNEFQGSVFAWETSDQLLQRKHDVESTYFAAQTMRSKILYSFRELPENSHDSLKESLLRHIEQLFTMSPIILTQLSLAVCDLALQMPSWRTPAVTFIQSYGNNKESLLYLLELLTLLPEEVNNRTLRLGANRRSEIMEEMENCAPMVIDLLKACLGDEASKNEKTMGKLFRCLGSWFQLGVLPGNHVARIKLLDAPFDVLRDVVGTSNQLYESACECICAALYATEDVSRHRDLIVSLFRGTHDLRETFHTAVAHEDTDKCMNLCRVFSELSETLLEAIVSQPNDGLGDLKTLDLLLICNGHFQYEVAEITFNVWYRLADMLHDANPSMKQVFGPYIQRLIHSLVSHCQMEPDAEKVLDESEDFYDFRIRVADLVRDVVGLIGATHCFVHLFTMLSCDGNSSSWDVTEATLFVMGAIAKYIDDKEDVATCQVLHAILSLPEDTHIILKHTSIILIGELSEWISAHPQLLDPILQFLTNALQKKELSSGAATSLQHLCETCTKEMTSHHASLVQLITVSDDLHISNQASLGLLKGVTAVLYRLSPEECRDCVRKLCVTQMEALQQIINSNTSSQGKDPIISLDRSAAIFRGLNHDNNTAEVTKYICQDVFKEIWPVLNLALEKYKSENKVIERWCRCIRFAVRCAGKSAGGELLEIIAEAIALAYQTHQHSCFLYLGSVLVDVYANHPTLLKMLNAFLEPLFRLLNEEKGLENNPDTVDDLFRLCNRFIEHSPLEFLSHAACAPLLQCAITCLRHEHREANAAVTKFLRSIISCRRNEHNNEGKQIVEEVIGTFGYSIINQSLQACLFHIPSYLYPDIAELWWSLLERDRRMFSEWLKETLKNLPAEATLATATSEQTWAFHSQLVSSTEWKSVSYHLRDFCRLYR